MAIASHLLESKLSSQRCTIVIHRRAHSFTLAQIGSTVKRATISLRAGTTLAAAKGVD
jgi:hypothetical protein